MPLTPRFPNVSPRGFLLLAGLALAALAPAKAQVAEAPYSLPPFATYSEQVANQTPVATFAMPVSGLRFEPRVDVQSRNLAEAQADVTIRGGIFENTGFKLGALSLYDPQTGHYFAEIPVAPEMLTPPKVLTGVDNALAGFNAEVGTVAYGWKGGIGTSSRRLPTSLGGWTVGVLVQSNYGGILTINGAPVGRELGRFYLRDQLSQAGGRVDSDSLVLPRPPSSSIVDGNSADGSIMMIVATDAPVGHHKLERLARRALAGLARTGSSMSNGSGDFVVAFGTVPITKLASTPEPSNDQMSPLFEAAIEATEEAIYNSMFLATTVKGYRGTVSALPLDSTLAILRKYGAVRP